MKFFPYKIKLTVLMSFIIFFVISSTGIGFFYFMKHKTEVSTHKTLSSVASKISNMDTIHFDSVVHRLEKLDIDNIIDTVVGGSSINKKVRKILGLGYVSIYTDNDVVFENFDTNLCDLDFNCEVLKKNGYTIVLARRKADIVKNVYNDMYYFVIISFILSICLSPLVYIWIGNITKPLEENFEFMKNFVNNAGHEIKTPLANINLSAQILSTSGKYDDKIVKDIIIESARLGQMVDTLLDLSILSKSKNIEKINIDKEIDRILGYYKSDIDKKNITVNKNIKQQYIISDLNHIEILLQNLISNAVKYNLDNGQINIYVDNNIIKIENTGIKLSTQDIKRIFDLFYRLETRVSGHGLGLSLVKKIVELHNWKMEVKSENGLNSFVIKIT